MEQYTIGQVKTLLDEELTLRYEKYCKAHEQLNTFADRRLTTPEEVDEVNGLLKEIQDGFREIYPILFWIQARQEFSANVIKEYNGFIERLKEGGAQLRDENEPEPARS